MYHYLTKTKQKQPCTHIAQSDSFEMAIHNRYSVYLHSLPVLNFIFHS